MKKGFTLIEVNLAILVMATGILAILGLYSLGFRENRQSAEDVASAAYADAVISPLVMALSSTNVTWNRFKNIGSYPDESGWGGYLNGNGRVISNPYGTAQGAYGFISGRIGDEDGVLNWPSSAKGNLSAGLVIQQDESKPAVVHISFRASAIPTMLMSAPMYYTSVRFQGTTEE